jgi:cytochrome P450
MHFCLGAPLARMEATAFIRTLLERFSRIELAAEPVRRAGWILRGLEKIPVAVST